MCDVSFPSPISHHRTIITVVAIVTRWLSHQQDHRASSPPLNAAGVFFQQHIFAIAVRHWRACHRPSSMPPQSPPQVREREIRRRRNNQLRIGKRERWEMGERCHRHRNNQVFWDLERGMRVIVAMQQSTFWEYGRARREARERENNTIN